MDRRIKEILINFLVAFLLGAGVFCLIYFLRRLFDFGGASDACFGAGASLLGITLLIIIGRTGVFDVLFYGFFRFGESFRPDNKKKYDTAYDFKEKKRQDRARSRPLFWPYLGLGGLYLVLAFVFLMVYNH
jgi:hypothetical protein